MISDEQSQALQKFFDENPSHGEVWLNLLDQPVDVSVDLECIGVTAPARLVGVHWEDYGGYPANKLQHEHVERQVQSLDVMIQHLAAIRMCLVLALTKPKLSVDEHRSIRHGVGLLSLTGRKPA